MEVLPIECFNNICTYLNLPDLAMLALTCKAHALQFSSKNNELWNLLLCQRLWIIDPCKVLFQDDSTAVHKDTADWEAQFHTMVGAEQEHRRYLSMLKNMNLECWIERHFLGQLASHWNGWERRFWAWSSEANSFSAFADESKFNCYATFPVTAASEVRRVTEAEQVGLSENHLGDNRNPIIHPRPYVFTLTNTSFPMLWACRSEEQLQLWIDKITVTFHPLQFEGRLYQAPAKYAMPKRKPAFAR
jgi:hypothetical protein